MPRSPLPVGTWGRINTKQRGEKRWVAYARFRDVDGRTRQREAVGESREKASRALVKALQERAKESGTTITSGTRVEVLGDFWVRTKIEADAKRSVNTKQRYRYVVQTYISPGIGGLLLRECSVARLDSFVQKTARDVGPATAKLVRTCLMQMFAVAVREDAIPTNPARELEAVDATPKAEVRALDETEVRDLRAALRDDETAVSQDLHHLVDVLLATGARIGEVLALRWADVDLAAGTLRITGTVVRQKGRGLVRQDQTKGKKVRALRLPTFAVTMLNHRIATVPAGDLGLVFPSAVGGLREVTTVDRQWRTFRQRHPEWSWITPHSFRKTVATTIERAAGLEGAAEQLGHGKTVITARHYVATPDLGPDHRAVLEEFSR